MELAVPEKTALVRNTLTIDEIKAHVGIIHNVMDKVMKSGTHYGTIPGCGNKPTLLKPGAEKILTTFQLTALPIITNLSKDDEIRYMVTVNITTRDGTLVGSGVGECSSNEEKYKWRVAVCDDEWKETPDDRRREKWNKYGEKIKQVRTNPADIANTVLKMGKKRALVDACLTATAASDIFTQDIEDMPEELLNGKIEQPKHTIVPPPEEQPKIDYLKAIRDMTKVLSGNDNAKALEYIQAHGYKSTKSIPKEDLEALYNKVKHDYDIAFVNETETIEDGMETY